MVVSGNSVCLLQLQSALPRVGRKLPVRHIVELLDASIRGLSM
jgi:Fe-S oxidoreductase